MKELLSSALILHPYNPKSELTLYTDASKHALGAALTENGRAVFCLSRSFSSCERNYSQIEKEALAIVWATEHLKQFLLGRNFSIKTDHRPLVFLLNPYRAIPEHTSARLQRCAIKLMQFGYEVEYVNPSKLPHADYLSIFISYENIVELPFDLVQITCSIVGLHVIAEETKRDQLLQDVVKHVQHASWNSATQLE